MPELVIEPGESLAYQFSPPNREGAPCFIFSNPLISTPLTPGGEIWRDAAQGLVNEGYGALRFDLRGTGGSRSSGALDLEPTLLVEDLRRLRTHCQIGSAIFVGLGFGALIAAGAVLSGEAANGLVMINGLIDVGERLSWVNAAAGLLAAEGGPSLHMEALLPLLVNQDFLTAARASGALSEEYQKLDPQDGLLNLYRNAAEADWSLPLEDLALPVLVISGLQDRVFLDREVVNRRFAQLADARAEAWEDAGHLLPAERPQQLTRSLLRFARELEEGPQPA